MLSESVKKQIIQSVEALVTEKVKYLELIEKLDSAIANLTSIVGEQDELFAIRLANEFRAQPAFFSSHLQITSSTVVGAVREYLIRRGSPASAKEISDGLQAAGFEFPDSWSEKNRLKNLAITLSRNPTFREVFRSHYWFADPPNEHLSYAETPMKSMLRKLIEVR